MLKAVYKLVDISTRPSRFILRHGFNYLDNSYGVRQKISLINEDLRVVRQGVSDLTDEVLFKVVNDLSQLPPGIADKELEHLAKSSFANARLLLSNAASEFIKGSLLLAAPRLKQTDWREDDQFTVIEGELEYRKKTR